ncbi:cytochrome P450 [Hyaloraphidium curvatum]|nr:cytochrome P450 [Hyaloraphidium curvatum]
MLLLVAAALGVLFVAYLAWRYPDRAAFTPDMPDAKMMPGGVPIFGHAFAMRNFLPVFHEMVLDLAREHGDVLRMSAWVPGILAQDGVWTFDVRDIEHVLRDPYLFEKGAFMKKNLTELFGRGIFISDGNHWKVQRKISANIFNVRAFRDAYVPIFAADGARLRSHLAAVAARPGSFVDVQELLLRSTMDSFVKLSMSYDVGNLEGTGTFDAEGRYKLHDVPFSTALDSINAYCIRRAGNPLWPVLERFNGGHERVRAWRETVDGLTGRIVEGKRARRGAGKGEVGKGEGEGKDLLDFFMDTVNDDGSEVTDEQLKDMVRNMIIAGRDTTAQTLSWVVYRMSMHPEVADRMREEMDAVLGSDKNALPSYQDIPSLRYTLAVFLETLRLHSNVPMNVKIATADTVLPGTGTPIKAGQRVRFSTFAMGRLERVWGPDAGEFKPGRWLDEKGGLRREDSFKFAAFNAGPRICLGMDMAKQEAVVLMCALFRRFRLRVVREDDPEKWGDYEGRRGRYDLQATLAVRKALDVEVDAI